MADPRPGSFFESLPAVLAALLLGAAAAARPAGAWCDFLTDSPAMKGRCGDAATGGRPARARLPRRGSPR